MPRRITGGLVSAGALGAAPDAAATAPELARFLRNALASGGASAMSTYFGNEMLQGMSPEERRKLGLPEPVGPGEAFVKGAAVGALAPTAAGLVARTPVGRAIASKEAADLARAAAGEAVGPVQRTLERFFPRRPAVAEPLADVLAKGAEANRAVGFKRYRVVQTGPDTATLVDTLGDTTAAAPAMLHAGISPDPDGLTRRIAVFVRFMEDAFDRGDADTALAARNQIRLLQAQIEERNPLALPRQPFDAAEHVTPNTTGGPQSTLDPSVRAIFGPDYPAGPAGTLPGYGPLDLPTYEEDQGRPVAQELLRPTQAVRDERTFRMASNLSLNSGITPDDVANAAGAALARLTRIMGGDKGDVAAAAAKLANGTLTPDEEAQLAPRVWQQAQERVANLAAKSALPNLPTADDLIATYRRVASDPRTAGAENWYERLHAAVAPVLRNQTELLLHLLSATSLQSLVPSNFTMALKALAQYNRFGPEGVEHAGRYAPVWQEVKHIVAAHAAGGDLAAGLGETARKRQQFVRSFLEGRVATLRQSDPAAYAELLQDPYWAQFADETAATPDMWMMRAWGFPTSPNQAQFDLVRGQMVDAAARLGVAPRKLQAAVWLDTILRWDDAAGRLAPDWLPQNLDKIATQGAYESLMPGRLTDARGNALPDWVDRELARAEANQQRYVAQDAEARRRATGIVEDGIAMGFVPDPPQGATTIDVPFRKLADPEALANRFRAAFPGWADPGAVTAFPVGKSDAVLRFADTRGVGPEALYAEVGAFTKSLRQGGLKESQYFPDQLRTYLAAHPRTGEPGAYTYWPTAVINDMAGAFDAAHATLRAPLVRDATGQLRDLDLGTARSAAARAPGLAAFAAPRRAGQTSFPLELRPGEQAGLPVSSDLTPAQQAEHARDAQAALAPAFADLAGAFGVTADPAGVGVGGYGGQASANTLWHVVAGRAADGAARVKGFLAAASQALGQDAAAAFRPLSAREVLALPAGATPDVHHALDVHFAADVAPEVEGALAAAGRDFTKVAPDVVRFINFGDEPQSPWHNGILDVVDAIAPDHVAVVPHWEEGFYAEAPDYATHQYEALAGRSGRGLAGAGGQSQALQPGRTGRDVAGLRAALARRAVEFDQSWRAGRGLPAVPGAADWLVKTRLDAGAGGTDQLAAGISPQALLPGMQRLATGVANRVAPAFDQLLLRAGLGSNLPAVADAIRAARASKTGMLEGGVPLRQLPRAFGQEWRRRLVETPKNVLQDAAFTEAYYREAGGDPGLLARVYREIPATPPGQAPPVVRQVLAATGVPTGYVPDLGAGFLNAPAQTSNLSGLQRAVIHAGISLVDFRNPAMQLAAPVAGALRGVYAPEFSAAFHAANRPAQEAPRYALFLQRYLDGLVGGARVVDALQAAENGVKHVFGDYSRQTALWGIWHLPLALDGSPLAGVVASLLLVHVTIGVPLSFAWRRAGNLVLPATAHALIDAVRDGLSVGL